MTAIFLLIWFYVYAGLLFVMVSDATLLFPKWGYFWQVVFWPVFFGAYCINRLFMAKK
jgi:hypothetical protein